MRSETKASYLRIVHSYFAARIIFDTEVILSLIKTLHYSQVADLKYDTTIELGRLLYRATRWLLKQTDQQVFLESTLRSFKKSVDSFRSFLEKTENLSFINNQNKQSDHNEYRIDGSFELTNLFPALDMHMIAAKKNIDVTKLFPLYKKIERLFLFDALKHKIDNISVQSEWEALGRVYLREDLNKYQMIITEVLIEESFDQWQMRHQENLDYWNTHVNNLLNLSQTDFINFYVILRFLEDFIR
jgi:glutamate dehydrogenase